ACNCIRNVQVQQFLNGEEFIVILSVDIGEDVDVQGVVAETQETHSGRIGVNLGVVADDVLQGSQQVTDLFGPGLVAQAQYGMEQELVAMCVVFDLLSGEVSVGNSDHRSV